jgi:uncharacterized protein
MITDLEKIKFISKRNEDKNWKFRSYLKMQDDREIDNLVKPIYRSVIESINCLECGNCCRILSPSLLEKDIRNLGLELGLTDNEILQKYSVRDEFNELRLKEIPCTFLEGNLCTIYKNRPEDCRSFPHIHKKGFTSRLIGMIENAAICPIVFNVFEELKIQLRYR